MTDEQLLNALTERFEAIETAPFLFVGSGIAQRYLGIESWSPLLRRFAPQCGKPFDYYKSRADGDLARTASEMAADFHEVWWADEAYEDQRAESAERIVNIDSPLKLEISQYIAGKSGELDPDGHEFAEELRLLADAKVDGVITTNWDLLLEQMFPEFQTYIGQESAIFSDGLAIAEIFKIHGCCTAPNSLVLSSRDYDAFAAKNKYLAAKLLTIFLEHPVVFLGYSLSDSNVRAILEDVLVCLDDERLAILGERLLFVEWMREPGEASIETATLRLSNRDLRLTVLRTHSFTPLYRALGSIERRISASLLRQIKEHVYELVQTHDPRERITVVDIEDLDTHDDVEFVVGVGVSGGLAQQGLVGVSARDLFLDVVHDTGNYDAVAADLVSESIPGLLRGRKLLPICRYLEKAGLLNGEQGTISGDLPESIRECAFRDREEFEDTAYDYLKDEVQGKTIADLLNDHTEKKAAALMTFIDPPLDELAEFLRERVQMLDASTNEATWYRKLVCLYDRRRFGLEFGGRPAD